MPPEVTGKDGYRCVVFVRFKVIIPDKRGVTLYRPTIRDENPQIEIHEHDIRETYKHPVIKNPNEIRKGSLIEVRVYDAKAVNLTNVQTLLGDPADVAVAVADCREALKEEGWWFPVGG